LVEEVDLLTQALADPLFSVYSCDTPCVKYNANRVNHKELDDGQPSKPWQIAEFTHCI
jgi:hypothetical protein